VELLAPEPAKGVGRWSVALASRPTTERERRPGDEELGALRFAAASFDDDRVEPQQVRPVRASYAAHFALWGAEN
jgi:hypothetical protein